MRFFKSFMLLFILSACRPGKTASDSLTGHPGSSSSADPVNERGSSSRIEEQKSGERSGQSVRRSGKRQGGASEKKDDRNSLFPENRPGNPGVPGESSGPLAAESDEEQQFLLLRSLLCTVNHFFGGVKKIFENISDPRNPAKTVYPLSCLSFAGVLMFLFGFGARRQIGHLLRNNGPSASKFSALFNTEECPHGDTLNAVFMNLSADEMQETVTSLTETLIRKKVLYRHRLLNRYFVTAVDGTGVLTFRERHCEHCLTRKMKNGKTQYYHNVLEAKLITFNGFAFSLMTEFIENPEENVSKQDCELKAFYRLAGRLKKRFPRLPLCLSMDGLFAGGPTFGLCEKNGWKYAVTLKDKDLPGVNSEFETLSETETGNRLILRTGKKAEIKQEFRWINDISHKDSDKREHTVSVLECLETKPYKNECKTRKFRWITNYKIHAGNAVPLATEGGRLRWKIENEGFNTQKNGGFELEHAYSGNENAGKIFYFLLQIAHILFQLIAKSSLFTKVFPKGVGSLKNIMFRLKEAWRNLRISQDEIRAMLSEKFQIRFDTS